MNGCDYIMGIDPGKSGGIVVIRLDDGFVKCHKMPDTIPDFLDFFLVIKEELGDKIFCLVEKVNPMPRDGVRSATTFSYNTGVLHTALTATGIKWDLVLPTKWQKEFFMKKNKGETGTSWKNRLKSKAQMLFPGIKVTLWSADALLIAEYCKRNYR